MKNEKKGPMVLLNQRAESKIPMAPTTIDIPFEAEKEIHSRFENWLVAKSYFWKRLDRGSAVKGYRIVIIDPMEAYWIGCNATAIVNKLFDGPLTRTL